MLQMSLFGGLSYNNIKESAMAPAARGAESIYYRISAEQGIKIFVTTLFYTDDYSSDDYSTAESLMASKFWKVVEKQMKVMQYLDSIRRGPQVFEMIPVYYERHEKWFPAMFMEHIDHINVHYDETGMGRKLERHYWRFKKAMEARFGDCDAHQNNAVFCKKRKRFVMIDAGKFPAEVATPEGRLVIMQKAKRIADEQRERDIQWQRKRDERNRQYREEQARNAENGVEVGGRILRGKDMKVFLGGIEIMPIKFDICFDIGRVQVEPEKLPPPGIERVRFQKRKHREFVNQFIPKERDRHANRFKARAA